MTTPLSRRTTANEIATQQEKTVDETNNAYSMVLNLSYANLTQDVSSAVRRHNLLYRDTREKCWCDYYQHHGTAASIGDWLYI